MPVSEISYFRMSVKNLSHSTAILKGCHLSRAMPHISQDDIKHSDTYASRKRWLDGSLETRRLLTQHADIYSFVGASFFRVSMVVSQRRHIPIRCVGFIAIFLSHSSLAFFDEIDDGPNLNFTQVTDFCEPRSRTRRRLRSLLTCRTYILVDRLFHFLPRRSMDREPGAHPTYFTGIHQDGNIHDIHNLAVAPDPHRI